MAENTTTTTQELMHDGRPVDIEQTIQTMYLDKPASTSVNWPKLRAEVAQNPAFVIEAANACRTRIVYKE